MNPWKSDLAECLRNRRIDVNLIVRNHSCEHGRNGDIENRAQGERSEDTDRYVATRVARLFSVCRHRVKANISEEDDRRARDDSKRFSANPRLSQNSVPEETDARIAIGSKRFP